jgi:hypothetical protein
MLLLFWDVMECSMVDSYLVSNFKVQAFSTLKMEEVGSSETYKTTRHHIPEVIFIVTTM